MHPGKEKSNKRFIPLKPQRLLEEVYRQLKEAILEGYYMPGDRLPSEQEFCKAFGVGRPVIREALRFLENSGLITVKAGGRGGAFVQKIDSSILFNTLEGIVKLDGISMEELQEARLALEMAALPLIMERIGSADIEALEANLHEVRENVKKGIRGKRNLAFHVLLFKASRNQLLIKIGEALFALMDKLLDRYEYSEERSRKVLEEHTNLVALLNAGKLKKARQAMEGHIHETIDSMRNITAVAKEKERH
jgi:GntR family transcriptional regulator, transcriptional repressor for pyruvate dehydrogenase complex